MTPEIIAWLQAIARDVLPKPGRVLEVGSYDVNGSPRSVFEHLAESYTGTDMQAGPGVDVHVPNHLLGREFDSYSFDTVICCEVLEHDVDFLNTLRIVRRMLKDGGHLIITTPTFGFPLHRYPKDYWRFGEDAYREVFFSGFDILDLRHLDSSSGANTTLAGIARKKSNE